MGCDSGLEGIENYCDPGTSGTKDEIKVGAERVEKVDRFGVNVERKSRIVRGLLILFEEILTISMELMSS